jgi:hypothetical protein
MVFVQHKECRAGQSIIVNLLRRPTVFEDHGDGILVLRSRRLGRRGIRGNSVGVVGVAGGVILFHLLRVVYRGSVAGRVGRVVIEAGIGVSPITWPNPSRHKIGRPDPVPRYINSAIPAAVVIRCSRVIRPETGPRRQRRAERTTASKPRRTAESIGRKATS